MNNRILGFDLARAYAIFGMFIVNFNTVFGSHTDESLLGKFLALFNGNSSTCFVVLAGMGSAFMTNRKNYLPEEKKRLIVILIKRSWFLFCSGLLLMFWWPADILHFYGGYMHIAIFLLFVPKKYYLLAGILAIIVFHSLLLLIPYEKGWNFVTLQYIDSWTIEGFLRNTFYNGWNSIFPWIAFYFFGMWLGRLDWQHKRIRLELFCTGLFLFAGTAILQTLSRNGHYDPDFVFYVTADYLPPFLPFMVSTSGFALLLLTICMYIGENRSSSKIVDVVQKTGQMTLTHYVSHLTIGFNILIGLTDTSYPASLSKEALLTPLEIMSFATLYFVISVFFSKMWSLWFKNGPLETLMRKISG